MSLIEILPDTNPVMRKTSRRVRHVDDKLRRLIADMYETMVENWGIGLAAVQVGVRKRFFIYEIPNRPVKGYETCHSENSPDKEDENPDEEEDDLEDEDEVDPGYSGVFTVCINPRIISREGKIIDDEGCLSKVGWMAKVERAYRITFQAYDLDMNLFERTVTGLEARCIQHETDHLDGILFTDRAEPETLREVTDDEEEDSQEPSEERETGEETAGKPAETLSGIE